MEVKEKISGIYKITSPSGRIYIGQSKDIYKRWNAYKNLESKSQPRLHKSLLKYGYENHEFEIIQRCDHCELNDREIFYINFFNTFNSTHGLNLKMGGLSGVVSAESLKKIGDGNRGKKLSDETKALISKNNARYNLGKKASPETREKIRQARLKQKCPNTGKKRSPEICARFSEARKGIKPTAEAIEKRRQGQLNSAKFKATMASKEYKEKISKALKGRVFTEEWKENLRIAWKRRKALSIELKQQKTT